MRNFCRTFPGSTRQEPEVVVIKKAEYRPYDEIDKHAAVGETVTYDIVATNIGNVDMTGTAITDSLFDLSEGRSPFGGQPARGRLATVSFMRKSRGK